MTEYCDKKRPGLYIMVFLILLSVSRSCGGEAYKIQKEHNNINNYLDRIEKDIKILKERIIK